MANGYGTYGEPSRAVGRCTAAVRAVACNSERSGADSRHAVGFCALVADAFGISRTAQVLRVNPSRLKRRLAQKLAASVPELEGEPRFVALGPFASNVSCECLLELEDG